MLKPPWVTYQNYSPYDSFWRQSGYYWFAYEWEPFGKGLSEKDKVEYLKQWQPPQVWIDFYFDTQWLDNDIQ